MALLPAQRLTKPHGVLVTTEGKQVIKEFDTPAEREAFIEQLRRFPNVKYEVIERQLFGKAGRATSLAFTQIKLKDGTVTDKCVRVPPKRGYLFCTECHDYRKFKEIDRGYGAVALCCPVCLMSVNDFYIKTANGLWDMEDKRKSDGQRDDDV